MLSTTNQAPVIGVFASRSDADRAVDELLRSGFRNDQIGVAIRDTENRTPDTDGGAGTGALAGAVAGAGVGGLVGLGILSGLIPVIGPVIAGGTLAVLLANAAGGAAIGGLVGALMGWGVPEDEARYYESEFQAGRCIVTVRHDGRPSEAWTIMARHGASTAATAGVA
jgi:hypothetical protein